MTDEIIIPGAGFEEKFAEADGFSIRYMEAGSGPVIVSLHGANGFRLSRTHDMLAESHRVIVVEVPGFGGAILGVIHAVPWSSAWDNGWEVAAISAALGGAIGFGAGAIDSVNKYEDEIASCLSNKGYIINKS